MMQLYGAMAYRDCTKAVLATDRECMADAVEVANKVGIEILYLNGNEDARQMNANKEPVCVENLQGRTIACRTYMPRLVALRIEMVAL